MSENWKTYKLGEIARFINGRAYANDEFRNSGTPIVRIQNLTGKGNVVYSDLDLPADKLIEKGDLIYAWSATFGPYIWKGAKSIYHYHIWKIICGEGVLDKHFFYYKLKYISDSIKGKGTGSIFTHITKSLIEGFESNFPEYSEQRRIAEILSALDEKIELNLEMNRTLERIAQATFKHWFVDFQFPGFDGELVDGLPKGWRNGKLADISTNFRKSVNPKDVDSDTPYFGLEHLPQKSIALSDWGKADDAESLKSKLNAGDILFGKIRPYFHKVGIAPIDGICSTDILVIQAKKKEFFGLALTHFSSEAVVKYATLLSNGAKMPRTSWNDLANYEIVIPTENIAEKFSELIYSLTERIKNNIFENKTLTQIRDGLLPKLMSGKIRVGE